MLKKNVFLLSTELVSRKSGQFSLVLPFPKRQILNSSKLKEIADDNFIFEGNGWKFSKREENTVGKEEISPFPAVFSKDLYNADT